MPAIVRTAARAFVVIAALVSLSSSALADETWTVHWTQERFVKSAGAGDSGEFSVTFPSGNFGSIRDVKITGTCLGEKDASDWGAVDCSHAFDVRATYKRKYLVVDSAIDDWIDFEYSMKPVGCLSAKHNDTYAFVLARVTKRGPSKDIYVWSNYIQNNGVPGCFTGAPRYGAFIGTARVPIN